MKEKTMQPYTVVHPGRSPGPNLINTEDYKMHIVKAEYRPGDFEILIERWIPETGWTRTQLLLTRLQLEKLISLIAS